MKRISILSPDTVPLTLTSNAPTTIVEDKYEYSIEDKCTRPTGLGTRAWSIAQELSKFEDFKVTLFVPDINFPGQNCIDKTGLNFEIQSYNLKASTWNWSEELNRKFKSEDFVIIQTASGVGFLNGAELSTRTNLIVDGYVPIFPELPCSLLGKSSSYKKTFWNRFSHQYINLIKRSNCILYANDRQSYYYEGQLFSLGKLDWSAFQFAPLMKVPYGVSIPETVQRTTNTSKVLKLLWYGPIYPWYNPNSILSEVSDYDDISIDFVAVVHPRYKKSYYSFFEKFFRKFEDVANVNVFENYDDNRLDLYSQYDAGIILAKEWLEDKYSVRGRVLDMISNGLPVFLNKSNALFHELSDLNDSIYPIEKDNLIQNLTKLSKNNITVSDTSLKYLKDNFEWSQVVEPLVDYIKRFYYDSQNKCWNVSK